jgi:hypothetical protein|tara:strand:- start:2378 stop:2812 length:435 start_codon:yes stop_codon:yes gene_type:complete
MKNGKNPLSKGGQNLKPGKPEDQLDAAAKAKRDLDALNAERRSKNPDVAQAKAPNVFKMMKSFGKDLKDYVKAGAPNCSEEDYKKRLLTCNMCPHLLKNMMRCGKCGCLVEHKAKWKTTTCPEKKWEKQDLTDLKTPKPKSSED